MSVSRRLVGVLLFLLVLLPATASSSDLPRSTDAERVTNGFDPAARAERQRELYDVLLAEQLPIDAPGISVELSAEDRQAMAQQNREGFRRSVERRRIGVVKPVVRAVDFQHVRAKGLSDRPQAFALGNVRSHAGGLAWTARVDAVEASALRLHFTAFNMPSNAELYIFNDYGELYGPYVGRGRNGNGAFWSHTLRGESAYLHLRFSGDVTDEVLRGIRFTVNDVAHIGPDYRYVNLWENCNAGTSCVRPVSSSDPSVVDNAKNAVAHMQFVSGAYVYLCSGGLLNDTDSATQRNYFLTANHCVSRSSEASSLQTYFFYNDCPIGAPPGTIGATLLSSARKSDYTLLELQGPVPGGSVRLGWTTASVARSNGVSLHRISHPSGGRQAYSTHTVDSSAPTCRSWPRGSWIYSRDVYGATEGGSSGSPVLNAAGQVVGQLSGACGYNVNDVCDNNSNATVDGAFAAYFGKVSGWLDTGPATGNQPPTAGFTYGVSVLDVDFTDTSTDPDGNTDITSWLWNFGDGSTSPTQNPSHTYAVVGTYQVSLIVTDAQGATDTASGSVTISDGSSDAVSIASLSGEAAPGRRGRWNVRVDIGIVPSDLDGAVVSGSWGERAKGSASCTTVGGQCSVSKNNLKLGGSATFTVTSIEAAGYSYAESDNEATQVNVPSP